MEKKPDKEKTEQEMARLLNGHPLSEHAGILSRVEKLVREPTPEEIKEIQAKRLISLGFHEKMAMSEDEFFSSVPLPKREKTGHILVVSAKYLSPHTSTQLIDVNGKRGKNYLNLDYLIDTDEAKVPQGMFYWRYGLDDGRDYCGTAPDKCFKLILKAKRIPGTANESIYVVAQKPEILLDHYLDCPGSRSDRNHGPVPYLPLSGDGPRLSWRYAGYGDLRFGSFSFGE